MDKEEDGVVVYGNQNQETVLEECDVKECTSEVPIGSKSVLPEKKSARRNTVPHPFALATEKRVQNHTKKPKNKKLSDEEDSNCSVASYATSAAKSSKSSAPSFQSTKRAERRKEFYIKLEEKHQAMEVQKTHSQARIKEENDAALKLLRKSLMFKAKPMPNFYHEGPPPKIQLKKPPPTRPKSPKLGRRNTKGGSRRKTLVVSKEDSGY